METRIAEVAQRIKGLRKMLEISKKEMAAFVGLDVEQYIKYENAMEDLNFTFLYKCAEKLGVDIIDLLMGENPHLLFYSIVRKEKGLDMKRREGFKYEHLAYKFKNKLAETFLVTAPYIKDEQDKPISLSFHKGQEFDYIISGSLKVQLENHTEILNPGDSIYYDSGRGHGMLAVGGKDCKFIAVVIKDISNRGEKND